MSPRSHAMQPFAKCAIGSGERGHGSTRAEAIPKLLVAIQEDASPIAYQGLIACYAHLGRLDEARDALSRLRSITPVIAPPLSRLAMLMPEFKEVIMSGSMLS
jgi:pentatricopeptide repeat protein